MSMIRTARVGCRDDKHIGMSSLVVRGCQAPESTVEVEYTAAKCRHSGLYAKQMLRTLKLIAAACRMLTSGSAGPAECISMIRRSRRA